MSFISSIGAVAQALPLLGRLDQVGLNPQPLPPKELFGGSLLGRLDQVGLNPQPLPPKELFGGSLLGRLDQVGLNPQPLPPKELFGGSRVSQLLDDFCGTVPKRFPPPPPPPLGGGLLDTANVNAVLDGLRVRF